MQLNHITALLWQNEARDESDISRKMSKMCVSSALTCTNAIF